MFLREEWTLFSQCFICKDWCNSACLCVYMQVCTKRLRPFYIEACSTSLLLHFCMTCRWLQFSFWCIFLSGYPKLLWPPGCPQAEHSEMPGTASLFPRIAPTTQLSPPWSFLSGRAAHSQTQLREALPSEPGPPGSHAAVAAWLWWAVAGVQLPPQLCQLAEIFEVLKIIATAVLVYFPSFLPPAPCSRDAEWQE